MKITKVFGSNGFVKWEFVTLYRILMEWVYGSDICTVVEYMGVTGDRVYGI